MGINKIYMGSIHVGFPSNVMSTLNSIFLISLYIPRMECSQTTQGLQEWNGDRRGHSTREELAH